MAKRTGDKVERCWLAYPGSPHPPRFAITQSALEQCGADILPHSGYLESRVALFKAKLDDGVDILLFSFRVFSPSIDVSVGLFFGYQLELELRATTCVGLEYHTPPPPSEGSLTLRFIRHIEPFAHFSIFFLLELLAS